MGSVRDWIGINGLQTNQTTKHTLSLALTHNMRTEPG